MPLEKLNPALYNPRHNLKPGDLEYERLKRSIIEFGYVDPVIYNRLTGRVVGGHQRLTVLKEMGIEQIEVSVVDLPEDKEKALNLALNKIQGGWDEEKLAALLADLEGAGYDLALTGFDRDELDNLIGGKKGGCQPDDIPETPKDPVSQRGMLWTLGKHRLLCGDSTCCEDVLRLMNGKKAKLFATDPPYLVDYTGDDRPEGSGKDWSGVYHEIEIKGAREFWEAALGLAMEVINDDAAWYCWHAHKRIEDILAVWHKLGILCHQQIIWVKPVATFGHSYWPWQHEPCLFGWREKKRPKHDGDATHKRTTVWRAGYQKSTSFKEASEGILDGIPPSDVWELNWEGKSRVIGNEHPTQKPVEIFAIPIRKHTQPGDICYEPFSGSGSQLIAAEMTDRVCYAMEIEPVFVDVAVRRWEEFTGQKAQLISLGGDQLCAADDPNPRT